MKNRFLSENFNHMDNAEKKRVVEVAATATENVESLYGTVWSQAIGDFAFGGIPETLEGQLERLEAVEKDWRELMGVASARPGGKRSGGTGFKLVQPWKSYKSHIKTACELGVEVLDAEGMPKSQAQLIKDCKEAKEPKSPEQKFAGAVSTLVKIAEGGVDETDPLVTGAISQLEALLKSLK